ncbi:hypothetical protein CEUSTIGMA_g19.t1 [Chlamydomonas eustigma]|uniref:Uncharacterized protein n=1 Tax=Chlamydomonas eustigma TaxID=1157962 RepID=A0A250WP17_9CHLO|nr:hypothetical protein CEUSTIGMA_g19.t1 [Chlamydomonas eustigma]|eukprot:GAX72563.1 hypothetical protein CEUSTIGMA_g19.t1 [Chlamydomonas eustigma]
MTWKSGNVYLKDEEIDDDDSMRLNMSFLMEMASGFRAAGDEVVLDGRGTAGTAAGIAAPALAAAAGSTMVLDGLEEDAELLDILMDIDEAQQQQQEGQQGEVELPAVQQEVASVQKLAPAPGSSAHITFKKTDQQLHTPPLGQQQQASQLLLSVPSLPHSASPFSKAVLHSSMALQSALPSSATAICYSSMAHQSALPSSATAICYSSMALQSALPSSAMAALPLNQTPPATMMRTADIHGMHIPHAAAAASPAISGSATMALSTRPASVAPSSQPSGLLTGQHGLHDHTTMTPSADQHGHTTMTPSVSASHNLLPPKAAAAHHIQLHLHVPSASIKHSSSGSQKIDEMMKDQQNNNTTTPALATNSHMLSSTPIANNPVCATKPDVKSEAFIIFKRTNSSLSREGSASSSATAPSLMMPFQQAAAAASSAASMLHPHGSSTSATNLLLQQLRIRHSDSFGRMSATSASSSGASTPVAPYNNVRTGDDQQQVNFAGGWNRFHSSSSTAAIILGGDLIASNGVAPSATSAASTAEAAAGRGHDVTTMQLLAPTTGATGAAFATTTAHSPIGVPPAIMPAVDMSLSSVFSAATSSTSSATAAAAPPTAQIAQTIPQHVLSSCAVLVAAAAEADHETHQLPIALVLPISSVSEAAEAENPPVAKRKKAGSPP